jgi:hypothetical protein
MNARSAPPAHGARDDLGKLASARDLFLAARLHDGAGDGAGFLFFAIDEDDARKLGFLAFIDDIGRARPGACHAHVERPVGHEGKAAPGLIELHGRNPHVERDAIHRRDAALVEQGLHITETPFNEGETAAKFLFDYPPARQRFGVPVDRIDLAIGFLENGPRIAARPERSIDIDPAIFGRQTVEHIAKHHRHMKGGWFTFAHCAPPLWPPPCPPLLGGCTVREPVSAEKASDKRPVWPLA